MDQAPPHDVFSRFVAGCTSLPNWVGVLTRREFFDEDLRFVTVSPPLPDPEIFEWIDVLEAVTRAQSGFTMLELGAGYGRWTVNAAAALRAYSGLPHSLTAVEAEPTHFRWLQLHCADNGVDATLIHAAVASTRGTVEFAVGEPASWYGQAIADGSWSPERVDTVAAVTLSDLLRPLVSVDLIHCDIQGAEAEVFEEAAQSLDAQVKRVHVGTHGAAAEQRVRDLFSSLRWKKLNDYACGTSVETPFGAMGFQDGVQTWLNTRLSGHQQPTGFAK
jgi:FkbM family methyltransferase